jgi:CheY-like chemotaxis protein
VRQQRAVDRSDRLAHDIGRDLAPLVVLAVDDDSLVLTNTVAMLEDLGHSGLAASSGEGALDILRQHGSVDLVITDYAMPNMTGFQLANAIKKEWPGLPVIIATGFAEMEPKLDTDLPRISKPFTETVLAQALSRINHEAGKEQRRREFTHGQYGLKI